MSTRGQMLADVVRATTPLVTRFYAGIDAGNATAQAPNLPNHAAWCLGHCALTMHRMAERFDGEPLPADAFVTGDGRSGGGGRYDTESVCFGSTPTDEPALYPDIARGLTIFEGACERLARACEGAGDAQLDSVMPWGKGEFPAWMLLSRVVFHNATHAGQLTDLRRALGLGRVIG